MNGSDPSKLDRIVAEARRAAEKRERGYREQALKIYPWICGRCAREFTHANLRELTVHHRDHNHDNNPPDGSNWELLCLYCHDNEHQRQLEAAGGGNSPSAYEKMLKLGGARFAVKLSGIPAMESLYEELPNFSEVLDDIRKQIALCASSNDPLELPPLLLVGEPGIGKTHFGRRLAQLLATGFGFVSMNAMTAGWILSGASSQWKNAKPGKVFDTLLHGSYANPVIVVDEIDKAGVDAQYDPLGALYGLLERDTASQFVDEFVEIPVDASSLVWIATANDAARIPEPILNRVNVYEIEAPDREGARRIAQSIYSEIRGGHDWGKAFPEAPAEAVLDGLADLGPREMRRALMTAFGNAKLAGRDEIQLGDLSDSRAAKKQRIGF